MHAGLLTPGNSPLYTLSPGTFSPRGAQGIFLQHGASHVHWLPINKAQHRATNVGEEQKVKVPAVVVFWSELRSLLLEGMRLAFTVRHRWFTTSWLHSAGSNSTEPCVSWFSPTLCRKKARSNAHSQPGYRNKKTPPPGEDNRQHPSDAPLCWGGRFFASIIIHCSSTEQLGVFSTVPRAKDDISALKLVERLSSSSPSSSSSGNRTNEPDWRYISKLSRERCAAFKTIGNLSGSTETVLYVSFCCLLSKILVNRVPVLFPLIQRVRSPPPTPSLKQRTVNKTWN